MNRRTCLTALTVLLVFALSASAFAQPLRRGTNRGQRPRGERTMQKHPSSHYYKADGSFNEDAARDAFADLFRFHRFSLGQALLDAAPDTSLAGDKIWFVDFKLGDFSNVGMAGIFYVNDKEHGYFGHDIFLLPYQMIPEHFHVPGEGKPAKHEAWQVRHGSIWCFSSGGSEADLDALPPEVKTAMKSQLDAKGITAFKGKELKVGEMLALEGLEKPHFMMAGPQGAIVTEYASYHAGEGLKFTNPQGANGNTEAKK